MGNKVAILGDTHLGVRGGSQRFQQFFDLFYTEIFFPYLRDNNIKSVIQMGDLWDQRKQIPVAAITASKEYFFDKLKHNGIHMWTLLGNHDIVFKSTVKVNTSSLLLSDHPNVTVIDRPMDVEIEGQTFMMLPWICADNQDEVLAAVQKSVSPLCCGHLELAGFEAFRGHIMHEGGDGTFLSKFDVVFSGHYHYRSNKGNIYYVGTPYEMTWSDYNDTKGFHVLDTETGDLEFIENPYRIFHVIDYEEDRDVDEYFLDQYKGCYVRVRAPNKDNIYRFENFMDKLTAAQPFDIKVIDSAVVTKTETIDTTETQDTISLIKEYVDALQITESVDKEAVITYIQKLYLEAQSAD